MTGHLVTSFTRLLLLACVSGCAVQNAAPPTAGDVTARTDRLIAGLLLEADTAFAADRLTTPAHDNALDRYQNVLEIDPSNQYAIAGINAIAEKYLSWAIDHARNGSFHQARVYLGRAESVEPDHPSLEPVATLINEQEQLKRERFPISAETVRNRDTKDPLFERIAGRIADQRPFVTIRAPDDAAGRWIYQQLNARVSFRVEARFTHSRDSSVELSR